MGVPGKVGVEMMIQRNATLLAAAQIAIQARTETRGQGLMLVLKIKTGLPVSHEGLRMVLALVMRPGDTTETSEPHLSFFSVD